MGTLENFDVHNLNDSNNKMTKEQVRDKVHKDKNIENALNVYISRKQQVKNDPTNYLYLAPYCNLPTIPCSKKSRTLHFSGRN